MIPDSFRLAHYQLTLEAIDALHLMPYKSSALRGGFGHAFKRLVCLQAGACDKRCQLSRGCPYGYIFETSPPDDSQLLRTFQDVPRPFIIRSPEDQRMLILPGEQLTFELILIGQGIDYLPYFIAVFRELGQQGLGRTRGKYRLKRVEALSPAGLGLAETQGAAAWQPVYEVTDEVFRTVEATVSGQMIAARAANLSTGRLPLHFLSPTRLKHQGRWIHEGPPFQILIRTLLGRISSLSYFHCDQRLELDFRALVDRTAHVQIVRGETGWQDWSRFSGRQQQRIEMGGLMGRVTYAGDLETYLPLLALGEWVHVGKGTVFGNGQYRIEA